MNIKSIIRERNQMEPYLLSNGTVNDYNQLFLIVDCEVLGEVSIQTVPVILLAVYFVYNICYPRGCNNLFLFFELMFLKTVGPPDKLPSSVRHFHTLLCNNQ